MFYETLQRDANLEESQIVSDVICITPAPGVSLESQTNLHDAQLKHNLKEGIEEHL